MSCTKFQCARSKTVFCILNFPINLRVERTIAFAKLNWSYLCNKKKKEKPGTNNFETPATYFFLKNCSASTTKWFAFFDRNQQSRSSCLKDISNIAISHLFLTGYDTSTVKVNSQGHFLPSLYILGHIRYSPMLAQIVGSMYSFNPKTF